MDRRNFIMGSAAVAAAAPVVMIAGNTKASDGISKGSGGGDFYPANHGLGGISRIDMKKWSELPHSRAYDAPRHDAPSYGAVSYTQFNVPFAFALVAEFGGLLHTKVTYFANKDWLKQARWLTSHQMRVFDSSVEMHYPVPLSRLKSIAFDPFTNHSMVMAACREGENVVHLPYNRSTISKPTEDIVRRIYDGTLAHDGNPYLYSEVSECSGILHERVGDRKYCRPCKLPGFDKSRGLTGGLTAIVMANALRLNDVGAA